MSLNPPQALKGAKTTAFITDAVVCSLGHLSGPSLSSPQRWEAGVWGLLAASPPGTACDLGEPPPLSGSACVPKLVRVGAHRPNPLPQDGMTLQGQPSFRAHQGIRGAGVWLAQKPYVSRCPLASLQGPRAPRTKHPACKSPSLSLFPGNQQLKHPL